MLIIRIISIILIIVSLLSLWNWNNENKENNGILKEVLSNVKTTETIITDNGSSYNSLTIDFNGLKNKNADTVGWINLNNTSVNYSIVKTSDNNYYLNHNFNKSYNSAGWIFMDYRCNDDFSSKNTVIYGHNRKDGSMFGTLKSLLNSNWYLKNSYITIATPEGNKIYQIFSIYKIKAESYYITTSFASESDYDTFLNTISKRSIYNFGIGLNTNDSIITLSTCTGTNNARTVIHAKLISIL